MSKQGKITSYFSNGPRGAKTKPLETIVIDDDDSQQCVEDESVVPKYRNADYDVDDPTRFFDSAVRNFLEKLELHYLLNADETKPLVSFSELPSNEHKKLFARMYWLQWKWRKVSDVVRKYLNCSEERSRSVVAALQKDGLLSHCRDMNFDDWASALTNPDLVKICKHFKLRPTKMDRSTMLANLKSFCNNKSTIFGDSKTLERKVFKMMMTTFGECVKITRDSKSSFDRLHLLTYMGMNPTVLREKQLNLLLMNIKNGKQCFPKIDMNLDDPTCVFPSRTHFDEFVCAYDTYEKILKLSSTPPCDHESIVVLTKKCHEHYEETNKNETVDNWCPPNWLHRFTPGYYYIKSMEIGIGSYKALKSNTHLTEALSLLSSMLEQKKYRQHKRALWYNENALILQMRLRQFEKAANVLIEGLSENAIFDDAKAPLRDRAKRLSSQKNIKLSSEVKQKLLNLCKEEINVDLPYVEISAKSLENNTSGKKAKYVYQDVIGGEKIYSSVEDYALLHYINFCQFTEGEHWEGRMITSIFVLLFWDIIYSNTESGKGLFLSQYQEAPLDLYTNMFYENRKANIEERLVCIKSTWKDMDEIIEFMKHNFDSRREGEISLLNNNLEWSKIHNVVCCLGRPGLFCICKRLSQMYYYAHSGFPDLTVWNNLTKKIKFVEVKGDGDRLSCKQTQWMAYLLKHGIETEVCYVHKGNKRKKTVKKLTEDKIKSNNQQIKKKRIRKDIQDEKSNKVETKQMKRRKRKKDMEAVNTGIDTVETNSATGNGMEENEKSIEISNSQLSSKSPKQNKSSPSSSKSPKNMLRSNSFTDCYLKSPTKFSKGVGYFVSPTKSQDYICDNAVIAKKRSSLSLIRKRIFDKDV